MLQSPSRISIQLTSVISNQQLVVGPRPPGQQVWAGQVQGPTNPRRLTDSRIERAQAMGRTFCNKIR